MMLTTAAAIPTIIPLLSEDNNKVDADDNDTCDAEAVVAFTEIEGVAVVTEAAVVATVVVVLVVVVVVGGVVVGGGVVVVVVGVVGEGSAVVGGMVVG